MAGGKGGNKEKCVTKFVIEILDFVHDKTHYVLKGDAWTTDIDKAQRYSNMDVAEWRYIGFLKKWKDLLASKKIYAAVKMVQDPVK